MGIDPAQLDLSNQFNTALSPEEEKKLADWLKTISPEQRSSNDYDIRGYFKKYGATDLQGGQHLTDEFKKPNHPSFSDESIYNGNGNQGGKWTDSDFTPGPTNLKYRSPKELQDYFSKTEPDIKLNLPDGAGKNMAPTDPKDIDAQIQEEKDAIARLQVAAANKEAAAGANKSDLQTFTDTLSKRFSGDMQGLGHMAGEVPGALPVIGPAVEMLPDSIRNMTGIKNNEDIVKEQMANAKGKTFPQAARESLDNLGHAAGSAAIAAGGAATLPESMPAALVAGLTALMASTGSSLYDESNQILGNQPAKSLPENLGNFAGDTGANLVTAAPAVAVNKIGRSINSTHVDVTDPNVISQVNLAHDMEFLSPKEAASILKTGKISDNQLKAINNIQETMANAKGATAAMGGFEKRTPRAYAVAEELASNLDEGKAASLRGETNPTTYSILQGMKTQDLSVTDGVKYLDDLSDQVMNERTDVVGRLETAQEQLKKNNTHVTVTGDDVSKIADNLDAKATDAVFYNKGLATELQEQAKTIRGSLPQKKPSLLVSRDTQAALDKQALAGDTGISIGDLHTRVVQINKEMRELGAFDAGTAAKNFAGDPSAGLMVRDKIAALRELRDQVEPLFYKKAEEVATRAGMPADAAKIKEFNSIYSSVRPLQQVLRTFSDEIYSSLMPKPTSSLQAQPNVNPESALKTVAAPTIMGKAVSAAKMLTGGPDASDMGRANLDLMTKRNDTRIGTGATLMNLAEQPKVSSFQKPLLGSLPSEAMAGGAVTSQISNNQAFPRKLSVIMQNSDAFLSRVQQIAPEAVQPIQDLLSGSYTPSEKGFRLGTLIQALPQLSSLMEPSRSGTASEMDGKIQSPEEKANVCQAIEDAPNMSMKQKAQGFAKVWKEGKYDGKAVYGQ